LKYLLGYDIGSSSVKAALLDASSGQRVAFASSPGSEMQIVSSLPGFAEQEPEMWWNEVVNATLNLRTQCTFSGDDVIAIGISYQMHGLVCVDKNMKPVRSSIIWCDSRAVAIGNKAFVDLGENFCLGDFLNSPGNFTASKLIWVKENEPDIFEKIYKVMLPGDYIALKLTGEATTTISGLSEGILWDYKKNRIAFPLLEYYGFEEKMFSTLVPVFGEQGRLSSSAASLLQLKKGIPISYRAGDQPNNAFSLNVLDPGEVATTAGTSGVVYGVTDKILFDSKSRVNTFVHVNHTAEKPRYGVLLCVNGTGILNSWLRNNYYRDISYEQMNIEAAKIPIGSEGLRFFPFGNGAERILENKDIGAQLHGLQFNRHHKGHVLRSGQEGIVFALQFGMSIMKRMGIELKTVRAGHANMFLSDVFAESFANTTGCTLELYNTNGAIGAARAAGVGVGYYKTFPESFVGMKKVMQWEPRTNLSNAYGEAYNNWLIELQKIIM